MLKAAIFDLDNTLYDYDAAHATAWSALTAFAGQALGLSPERFDALNRETFRAQRQRCGESAALHNRLIRYQMMLESLGKPVALAPVMANLYWTALLGCMEPLPGARETLKRLRAAGLTVGIGTNMTADYQFAKLERLGLMSLIDFIVTSEEAGAEKPDARLFGLCAEKAGQPPEACAFVGDNLEGDAIGARDAGLRAVWLCRKDGAPPPPDGVRAIHSLEPLCDLLLSM